MNGRNGNGRTVTGFQTNGRTDMTSYHLMVGIGYYVFNGGNHISHAVLAPLLFEQ